MNTVIIKTLSLKNFKGIRSLDVEFKPDQTFIHGDNETGKTSIFDAFTWLLFGKNSEGNAVFDIKTIDSQGNTIPKIDHEVEGKIEVKGRLVKLRKVYRENWVTRRGTSEEYLAGHETICYMDDVPVQISEYKRRINDIIDEGLFKLITDPYHFSRMDKKDKRAVLISMAGEITDETILKVNPELNEVIGLMEGKNIADEERRIADKINLIKKSEADIPARIDEANRTIASQQDWDEIKSKISDLEIELKSEDEKRNDLSKSWEGIESQQREIMNQIAELDREAFKTKQASQNEADIKNAEIKSERSRIDRIISEITPQIQRADNDVIRKTGDIESLEALNEGLRAQWEVENEKEIRINPEDLACPACHREYDPDKIYEIQQSAAANFNSSKQRTLKQIEEDGSLNNKRITELKEEIAEIQKSKIQLTKDLKDARDLKEKYEAIPLQEPTIKSVADVPDYAERREALNQQLLNIQKIIQKPDTSESDKRIAEIRAEIGQLQKELGRQEVVEESMKRLKELENQQVQLAQEKANLEKISMMITQYKKTRMLEIENTVNRMFEYVKFRMFKQQINGGDEEVCDALYKGVPYDSLNNAAKLNTGIDIINALCRHRETTAPIFIDNRESVTKIINTQSQIINLVVEPGCLVLTVKN